MGTALHGRLSRTLALAWCRDQVRINVKRRVNDGSALGACWAHGYTSAAPASTVQVGSRMVASLLPYRRLRPRALATGVLAPVLLVALLGLLVTAPTLRAQA